MCICIICGWFQEKLIKATPGKSTDEDLEKLIAAELVSVLRTC